MTPKENLHTDFKRNSQPLILHIPHASTHVPFYDGYVNLVTLQEQIDLLTDWYTDELFNFDHSVSVIAPFSRVFCDVERFDDEDKEIMSKVGMGMLYTHADDGSIFRYVNDQIKNSIVENYYHPHHLVLTNEVDKQLTLYGQAKIIDCHSFPNFPFTRDVSQALPRPDFNIGIHHFHTPDEWIQASQNFFENKGYSLGVDWPYSGTIVPMKYFTVNKNVHSIMLEVNRDLYLKKNSSKKNEEFNLIQDLVSNWLNLIYPL
jgi:N-formylglutamate amidohydrolase